MLGAKGSGVGIGALFSGLAGRSKPYKDYSDKILKEWGEEAIATERPSAFTGLVDTSVSQATGANPKAFENFAGTLAAAPLYYAGSGFATGLQFLSPGAFTKPFNFATKGISAGRAANKAYSEALGATATIAKATEGKINPSELAVQAVKTVKGEDVVLQKFLAGFTQQKQVSLPSLFRSSKAGIPGSNPATNLKFASAFNPGLLKFNLKKFALPDAFNILQGENIVGRLHAKGAGKVITPPTSFKDAQKIVGEAFGYDKELGTIIKSIDTKGVPKALDYTQYFATETKDL
jgi:hypothetical protein